MNRFRAGTLLTVALLMLGCAKDPTASLRAGPKRVLLSSSVLTVNVGDSLAVTATVVDEQGNPLNDEATATSTTPQIVSVIKTSGAPLPRSRFYVKALSFGEGKVDVTVAGITESIKVLTYPASLRITGTPDSLGSGTAITLTAVALSATNQPLTGIGPITWESEEAGAYCGEDCASVTSPGPTSTVTGKTPGTVNIIAHLPGGAEAQATFKVVPAAFNGTSPTSGNDGQIITITLGAGTSWDATSAVTIGGVSPLFSGAPAPGAISFAIPFAAAGVKEIVLTGLGADELAQRFNFTQSAGSLDDAYEATNNDPFTGPILTANGDYFIIGHGSCEDVGNGVGEGQSPGADCDDFFRITNTSGTAKTVTVEFDWTEENADPDLYLTDDAFDVLLDGSFTSHPESATAPLAAGETMIVWMNLYDNGAHPAVLIRTRVSGL